MLYTVSRLFYLVLPRVLVDDQDAVCVSTSPCCLQVRSNLCPCLHIQPRRRLGIVDHRCNRLPLRSPFVGVARRFGAEKEPHITLFIGTFPVHLSSLRDPSAAAEKEVSYRLWRRVALARWGVDHSDA